MLPGIRTVACTFKEYLDMTYGEKAMLRWKCNKPTIRSKSPEGCPGIVRQGNRAYSVSPIYAKSKGEET